MLTIDRFEKDMAVCEKADKTLTTIPRQQLPKECVPGDSIDLCKGVYVIIDNKERREDLKKRMQALFKKK